MNKKAIVLAVGALCAAPAAHAQIVFGNDTIGTVQFYGKLYPQVIWAKSSGATQPGDSVSTLVSTSGILTGAAVADPGRRLAVDSQNSYLGFRGERKLGSGGLKAIWQIEQSIEIDTGTAALNTDNTGTPVSSPTFSNRNSFLGLTGGFGTVKLGNMDTIYKEYGQVESMFGLTSGNFVSPSNILSHIGVGSSSTARFHERAPNSIQYTSPTIAGVQAGLQYSPDETRNDPGNTLNKELWSMGVKWESGPLYLSAQHERHKDRFGGSSNIGVAALRNGTGSGGTFIPAAGAHSMDTAWRASAAYEFGGHRIGADVARLKYDETGQAAGTRFKSYQHTTGAASLESKWGGPWRTTILYVVGTEGKCEIIGLACSTDGLKGQMLAGGVAYDLDSQTFLYVFAARLINGKSARYDNWAGGNPGRGGDIDQIALGMQYRF
jgi:predicted porin